MASGCVLPARLESGALGRLKVTVRGSRRIFLINGLSITKRKMGYLKKAPTIAELQSVANALTEAEIQDFMTCFPGSILWVQPAEANSWATRHIKP